MNTTSGAKPIPDKLDPLNHTFASQLHSDSHSSLVYHNIALIPNLIRKPHTKKKNEGKERGKESSYSSHYSSHQFI